MSSVEPVQGVSPQGRELRPELDLVVLQSYELARFYNLQELKMIQPIAVREEAVGRIAPAEPTPAPLAAVAWPVGADEPVVEAGAYREAYAMPSGEVSHSPRHATSSVEKSDHPSAGVATPAEDVTTCDAGNAPQPETLPYGGDAARIRQLVEWIVTGREVVPFTFHYRQAGDLVEQQSVAARPIVSARQVAAVYRAY